MIVSVESVMMLMLSPSLIAVVRAGLRLSLRHGKHSASHTCQPNSGAATNLVVEAPPAGAWCLRQGDCSSMGIAEIHSALYRDLVPKTFLRFPAVRIIHIIGPRSRPKVPTVKMSEGTS